MKHVVTQSDLREADIRPVKLLSAFMELSIKDSHLFFDKPGELVEVDCPACGCPRRRPAFAKHGFQYCQCEACGSVYVSPRPSAARLTEYYRESSAVAYRASTFIQTTGEARRTYILQLHANWLARLFDETRGPRGDRYADVGTNYPLIFDEISKLGIFRRLASVAPLKGLESACQARGAEVVEAPPADLDALTAFEQLEHTFSPGEFIARVHQALVPGGMLFLTTRSINGFDLQVLWDKTPYIYVPEHLNLLSVDGISRLLERIGFEVIELSTPGVLDVELVRQAMAHDPTIEPHPFFKQLLAACPRQAQEDFQEFLQKHRLSSHLRLAAVKK
ncbi:MAG: class I SAM-dependent methyltransferase [bacterium]|nr:class I SAM-dependent methyltransferase [bacterium]